MSSHAAPNTVPFTIDNVISGMRAFPDSPDVYRIRIQPEHAAQGGPTIKYLAAPNTSKTLTGPDAHTRRHNNLAFDRVPAGDWVVAQLTVADDEGEQQGKLKFASIEANTTDALNGLGLASAEPTWCGKTVDERDCRPKDDSPGWSATTTVITTPAGEKRQVHLPTPTPLQCMDYVSAYLVHTPADILLTHPDPAASETAILVKDWLPGHWAGISNESRNRQIIAERDPGLTPRLLAHVTENGGPSPASPGSRVVGFLLEHVPDAREAGIADLAACRAALARLHALGIVGGRGGGGLSRHSFLVRADDGSVMVRGSFTSDPEQGEEGEVLAGFGGGTREEIMRREVESLEEVLKQSPSEFEDQEAKILRWVDPQRVEILDAFQTVHGVILPFVYWQESREGGGRITLSLEEHGVLVKEYEENGFRWTRELQEKAEGRFGPSAKGV